ncbi:uncharacterized protein MONBRDRAFT_37435 [Monosiga brevicollis MX1]|uniref:PDZ domain-containing protein n=1 Tax=Monosiga brevicollis TaxID=81824 RepID=A9V1Q5_MONBE|nr:uncharacterized protein MONBRDRAFT_37435 [Monosiga brevicollis MX1]EDQ88603.1 predicted protein [Monosiga brevicollis MX1]|eukprot:XP_001746707.1 hypothetical protein [Monosiga brevicollis MX1]
MGLANSRQRQADGMVVTEVEAMTAQLVLALEQVKNDQDLEVTQLEAKVDALERLLNQLRTALTAPASSAQDVDESELAPLPANAAKELRRGAGSRSRKFSETMLAESWLRASPTSTPTPDHRDREARLSTSMDVFEGMNCAYPLPLGQRGPATFLDRLPARHTAPTHMYATGACLNLPMLEPYQRFRASNDRFLFFGPAATVRLEAPDGQFGLALVGVEMAPNGKDRAVLVKAIHPDAPAAQHKAIGRQDRIVAVNNVDVCHADQAEVVRMIQASGKRVDLTIAPFIKIKKARHGRSTRTRSPSA